MGRSQSGAVKPLVRIADVATGKLLHELPCKPGTNGHLRFSANGTWLVAAQDSGVLQVWDVARGQLVREVTRPFEGRFWTADISPDGKLLAAADRNTPLVQVWSLATGKLLPDLYATEWGPSALAFSRDGKKLASVTPYGVVSVWDTASGRLIEQLPAARAEDIYHAFEAHRLAWTDDGHVHLLGLAGSPWPPGEGAAPPGSMHLLDLTTGKLLRSFGHPVYPIRWWTVSADWRTLAAVVYDEVAVWDLATGQARVKLPLAVREAKLQNPDDDPGYPIGLAFAPNGKTLAVCDRRFAEGTVVGFGALTTRELASGKIRHGPGPENQRNAVTEFVRRVNGVATILFTADGKAVAVATRDGVLLWDVSEGREIRYFGGRNLMPASAAFSPDGKLLAVIQYRAGLCLWDVATGTLLRQVTDGQSDVAALPFCEVTALAFSGDGKALATAFSDTTVIVWDVKELLRTASPEPLSTATLKALWQDLANGDAAVAGKAIARLQKGGPAAAAFLKGQVQPVSAPDPKLLARLLGELEAAKFAVRDKAGQELERLGEKALPALHEILRGKPSLETKLRVTKLVARLEGPTTDASVLQLMRAIEVLEVIGGVDAQTALEALAKGMPGHRVTEAARDAQRRVKGM
jgi:WD40 repeat protein